MTLPAFSFSALTARLRPRARFGRGVALACTAAVLGTSCGDGVTSPRSLRGTYDLTRVEGAATPVLVRLVDGGSIRVEYGELRIDDVDYTMDVVLDVGTIRDYGSVRRSGSSLDFSSERFFDRFDGEVVSGDRVVIDYDLSGDGDFAVVEFRRR